MASQRELLLNAGLGIVEYDAIQIELLKVQALEGKIENAIFTSKNAVRAVAGLDIEIQQCFCVGTTTQKLLVEQGRTVVEIGLNAKELASKIVEKYSDMSFTFFCGNLRRDELPNILQEHSIALEEKIVYHTVQTPQNYERAFDGVLFFSPSAVQSHMTENNIVNSKVFCIGNTTASELQQYTDQIIIANKPTVENVIVQAVKYFK